MLSVEALAAAVHPNATMALSTRSPRVEDALRAEGLAFWGRGLDTLSCVRASVQD